MKSLLKRLADRAGYLVQQHRNLTGVDWARDTLRLLGGRAEIVFDVGANVGQTTRYFSDRFSGAAIHAFEPVSETYTQLVRAVGGLPGVRCHQIALSNESARREIVTTAMSVHASFESKLNTAAPDARRESVVTETADAFCARNAIDRIDVLKIDTEGHEMAVLDGTAGLFARRAVRAVYAELTPSAENHHNTPFTSVFDRLTGYGFRFMGLYEIAWLQQLPPETAFCNGLFVLPADGQGA